MIARLSLVGVLCLLGCGGSGGDTPDLGKVSGVVTVNGQPLANAIVTFTPQGEGRPSVGETNESGEYSLLYTASESGAMIGQHTVSVALIQADDEESYGEQENEEAATGLPPAATDGSIVKEVKSGSNDLNIEL